MAEEKQNDWLVSTLNQPDFNINDFINIGLTADNTELKDKEFYKQKDYFKNQFINEDGVFDEKAFDQTYDRYADAYKVLSQITDDSNFLEKADFSYNNLFVSDSAKRKANDFKIEKVKNPFRNITGTEGINSMVESGLTPYEIAQQNKLRDDQGNVLDKTANDLGVFGSIFNKDTYVMAQWDEDGEHEEEGRIVKHKKGEYKYDENGEFYLEALKRGEDVSGKKILNWTDVITTDGSFWNKIDVFDADGKDVGILKTTVKSALKVAPLLAGMVGAPAVATAYAGITAAMALGQTLPGLVKGIEGIINNADENNKKHSELWNTMNALEGWSKRFKGSTSENSQENMITYENFMSLTTDVGLQLGQQKFIAQIPSWLKLNKNIKTQAEIGEEIGKINQIAMANYAKDRTFNYNNFINSGIKNIMEANGKEITKFTNLTKNLSSTYMAITSAGDAWGTAKENGHNDRVAGMITLGTMSGLFGLMRYSKVGDWAIKGIGLPEVQVGIKQAVKEGIGDMSEAWIKQNSIYGTQQLEKGIFNKVKSKVLAFGDRLKNGSEDWISDLSTKALAEGIEEVSEETIADGMNFMANMGMFGKTNGKYDFSIKDFVSRYSMSFFGGMIGGGMHVGIERFNNRPDLVHKALDEETKKQLEYVTYKYGAEAVKEEIERTYQRGLIPASKTFSVTNFDTAEDGTLTPAVAKSEEESAAWHVKEALKKQVDSYASIMRGFTENSFEEDIQKASRYDDRLGKFLKLDSNTTIKDDYMNQVSKYIDARMELAGLADGVSPTNEQSTRLREAASEIEKFKNGEYFENYAELATFILDEELSNELIAKNKEQYAYMKYGKRIDELSEQQQSTLSEDYAEYTTSNRIKQSKLAFNTFKQLNSKFTPIMQKGFTNFHKTREVTKNKFINFNKFLMGTVDENGEQIFAGLHFNEEDLAILNKVRKEGAGVLDLIEIEEFHKAQETVMKKNEMLNKMDEAIDQYSGQMDSLVASQFLQKLDDFQKSESININKMVEELNSLPGVLTDISAKALPVKLKELFNINSKTFDPNVIAQVVSQLSTTDPESEFYISDEVFDNLDTQFLAGLEDILYNEYKIEDINDINWRTPEGEAAIKVLINEAINEVLDSQLSPEKIELLNRIEDMKQRLQNSYQNPIYDMLEEMNKMTIHEPSNLIKLLQEESTKLVTATDITDYVIENDNRYKEIVNLLSNIEVLKRLLLAGATYDEDYDQFGYNFFTNQIRKKFGKNTEILGEFSQADILDAMEDLQILKTKLEYLKELSEYNAADKFRSFKKAAVKLHALQYQAMMKMINKIASNTSIPSDKFKEFQKALIEGIEDINIAAPTALAQDAQEFLNMFDVNNEEQLAEIESFVTKLENKLFDNYQTFIKANPDIETEIAEAMMLGLDKNVLSQEKTSRLSETTQELTDYDSIMHFATVVGVRASDYKQVIQKSLADGTMKYAPVFPQEYAARFAVANVLSPKLFNALVENNLKLNENNYSIKIALQNMSYIRGFAGAGKTTGVLNIIDSVFKTMGISTTATSILESQTENIKKSLNIEEGFTKSQLKALLKMPDLTKYKGEGNKLNNEADKLIDALVAKGEGDPVGKLGRVIYIDEGTHYNTLELEFLSKFATRTGRSIILLGDAIQIGAKIEGKSNNIENIFKAQSPTLDFSIRSNNTHVKDNGNLVVSAASVVLEAQYNKESPNKIDADYKQNMNSIVFKYHEEANSFMGNKIVDTINENDVEKLISQNKDGKIGYIYQNADSETYQLLDKMKKAGKNIDFIHMDSIQGLEMDHFIIDVNLQYKDFDYSNHSTLVNTMFSRARQGSIILRNGSVFTSEDGGKARITEITEQISGPFKESRLNVLNKVLEDNPANGLFEEAAKQSEEEATKKKKIQSKTEVSIPGNVTPQPTVLTNETRELAKVIVRGEDNPVNHIEKGKDESENQVYLGNKHDYMIYGNINNWGGKKTVMKSPIDGAPDLPIIEFETQSFEIMNDKNRKVSYLRDMAGFHDIQLHPSGMPIQQNSLAMTKAKQLSLFRKGLMKYGSFDKLIQSPNRSLYTELVNMDAFDGSKDTLNPTVGEDYDWTKGTFKLVISAGNEARMRSINGDDNSKYPVISQIVYEVQSKHEDEPSLQITLGDLHTPTVEQDFKDEFDKIKQNGNYIYEVDLGNDISDIVKTRSVANTFISNSELNSRAGGEHGYTTSLYDLEVNDTRGLMVSEPEIIANVSIQLASGEEVEIFKPKEERKKAIDPLTGEVLKNPDGTDKYHTTIRGQAIVFICTEPDVIDPVTNKRLKKENMSRYYENYFKQELLNDRNGTSNDEYKPVIQYYYLNSSTTKDVKEYITNVDAAYTAAIGNDNSRDATSYYDPYHTGRIVFSIFENYAALKTTFELVQKGRYPEITQQQKAKLQNRAHVLEKLVVNLWADLGIRPIIKNGKLDKIEYAERASDINDTAKIHNIEVSKINEYNVKYFRNIFSSNAQRAFPKMMDTIRRVMTIASHTNPGGLANQQVVDLGFKTLQEILTEKAYVLNGTKLETTGTVRFPHGFMLHASFRNTENLGASSFSYPMYTTQEMKKTLFLDALPMGQKYQIDLAEKLGKPTGVSRAGSTVKPPVSNPPAFVPDLNNPVVNNIDEANILLDEYGKLSDNSKIHADIIKQVIANSVITPNTNIIEFADSILRKNPYIYKKGDIYVFMTGVFYGGGRLAKDYDMIFTPNDLKQISTYKWTTSDEDYDTIYTYDPSTRKISASVIEKVKPVEEEIKVEAEEEVEVISEETEETEEVQTISEEQAKINEIIQEDLVSLLNDPILIADIQAMFVHGNHPTDLSEIRKLYSRIPVESRSKFNSAISKILKHLC